MSSGRSLSNSIHKVRVKQEETAGLGLRGDRVHEDWNHIMVKAFPNATMSKKMYRQQALEYSGLAAKVDSQSFEMGRPSLEGKSTDTNDSSYPRRFATSSKKRNQLTPLRGGEGPKDLFEIKV